MSDFLYVHIPFCIRKCIYCDFLSIPYDDALAAAYVDAVCKELLLRKTSAGVLKSVYLGGGTPSLLDDACFRKLFSCLRDNFVAYDSAEITVEANPKTVDRRKVDTLFSLGINRISLGIQSFHDAELRILGRSHNADDAAKAVTLVQESGIKNISLDLIYGVPEQTPEAWGKTLSAAAGFAPSHISAYELTPEANTPLVSRLGSGDLKMPDEDSIIDMYYQAIDYLDVRGYQHYEISNFSLPGFSCIHNLNYWDRGEYIGVGAGAHSFIGEIRSRNTDDIRQYISKLNSSVLPVSASERSTPSDAAKEFLFLGLRKREGINLDTAKGLGLDLSVLCRELIDDRYIEIQENHLRLSRKGLVIANTVIVRILENLGF